MEYGDVIWPTSKRKSCFFLNFSKELSVIDRSYQNSVAVIRNKICRTTRSAVLLIYTVLLQWNMVHPLWPGSKRKPCFF